MYKFSSAGRDEAQAPPSAYYTDQGAFDRLKSKYYDENTDTWNGKGIKNEIALPCYNSADGVWKDALAPNQSVVTSTTNPATETFTLFNADGSVANVFETFHARWWRTSHATGRRRC